MLTNKDGNDIGQFLYTPFGEMWVEEASSVDISHITRFFTNQQYDKESGLYYYNARYYDPHLGSFITPDPAMDGLNHYAYANANPIKYTDPTGLFTVDWDSYTPGHWGDIVSDNNGTTDYMESQYGAVGFGTGGTVDTGPSSSSDSNTNPITNPYYDHPRSEPYVPTNTPPVNNVGSNNNYSPGGTNTLPSISYSNVPMSTNNGGNPNLGLIWDGSQYSLSNNNENLFCLVAAMLRDCVKQQGKDITIGVAQNIVNSLISNNRIRENGTTIARTGTIQNEMWSLLGNSTGSWIHSFDSNLNHMVGTNEYGYVYSPAGEMYNTGHWVSVNSIESFLFFGITNVNVFDSHSASYQDINSSMISNIVENRIRSVFNP